MSIGEITSIQDNVVIHTDAPQKVEIGNDVTVRHGAVLHECRIGNSVLIRMNATVLDSAEIEDNCIISANALVLSEKKIPARSLVDILENAAEYVRLLKEYKSMQDK